MRRTLAPLCLCLVLAVPCRAADPAPTIDQLLAKVAALRARQADLAKQEAAAVAELKLRLKELQDAIDRLGLTNPDPKPIPPAPPPKPADALRARLKAALDADPAAADLKREQARDLAALYRAAAKLAEDPAVTTSGELLRRVRDAAGALVGADSLKEVRRAGAAELAAVLPTDATLTGDQRAGAAALFRKLAALLEELNP